MRIKYEYLIKNKIKKNIIFYFTKKSEIYTDRKKMYFLHDFADFALTSGAVLFLQSTYIRTS